MSEENKKLHDHDCDCDCGCHDHDDCDCGCEEDVVMLQDENGNDVAFHFVTTLEHEGKNYVYLQGADDEDDEAVIEIFELESEEEGDEAYDRLYPVDDDLYEILYNKLLEEVQKQAELGDEDACEGCEEESCEGCPLDNGKND